MAALCLDFPSLFGSCRRPPRNLSLGPAKPSVLSAGCAGGLLGHRLGHSWNVNPFIIAVGADGKLSASKFQLFAWTGTVVFAYAWIAAARAITGGDFLHALAFDKIPANLLYATGFSVITAAGAKGITTALQGQRISKPQQAVTGDPTELLSLDDRRSPDLVKIQMLIWTLIAIVVYVTRVAQLVAQGKLDMLPDIDAPLMVLMGLGQAAYLGNKLTSSDVPTLTSLNPATAAVSDLPLNIQVSGSNLSGTAIVQASFKDQMLQSNPTVVAANATLLTFTLPNTIGTHGLGSGDVAAISLIIDGISSANDLSFTIK